MPIIEASLSLWFRNRVSEFSVLFISSAVAVLFWPWTQDDYGAFASAMAMGQFSDFALVDWYFLGYTGFAYLYCGLHDLVPQVNWIGGAMHLMQLLGLYVGLRTLRVALDPMLPRRAVWAVLLLMGLLYIDSLVSVSHTRASLILCGSALLALVTVQAPSRMRLLMLNAMFVTGLLHRSESAMGMLCIVGLALPMLRVPLFTAVRRLGPPVLFTGLFILGVFIYWHSTDSFIVKVEPEVEYEMMVGHVADLAECTTARDSSIHRMATSGIWFDTHVVTADAMRALLREAPFSPQRLQQGIGRLAAMLTPYMAFGMLIIMAVGLALWPWRRWRVAVGMALYAALCMVPLTYLAYRGLLAERHLFPMLWVMAAAVMLQLARHAPAAQLRPVAARAAALAAMLMMGSTLVFMFKALAERNRTEAQMVVCSQGVMQQMEQQVKGRVVVLTTGSFHIMDQDFSYLTEIYTANTYVMYDLFNYSLVPRYVDYQSKLCGCDASDPVQFFTWLAAQDALYLAEPQRVDITANHMQVVHGMPLLFVPADGFAMDSCLGQHYSYLRHARPWRVQLAPPR